MRNNFKNNFIFAFILCFVISCSTINKGHIDAPKAPNVYFVMPIVKHDTLPRLPKKPMTAKQLQDFVKPFFQMNIDTFITPKFDKLSTAITDQAKSINSLSVSLKEITSYMAVSRHRADSILRLKNEYQKKDYDNQIRALNYQKQINEYLKAQAHKYDEQIAFNTCISIGSLILVSILYLIWLFVYRKVQSLQNTVEVLIKELNHE